MGCSHKIIRIVPRHPPAEKHVSATTAFRDRANGEKSIDGDCLHATRGSDAVPDHLDQSIYAHGPLPKPIDRNGYAPTLRAICHADRAGRVVAYINLKQMITAIARERAC